MTDRAFVPRLAVCCPVRVLDDLYVLAKMRHFCVTQAGSCGDRNALLRPPNRVVDYTLKIEQCGLVTKSRRAVQPCFSRGWYSTARSAYSCLNKRQVS